MAKAVANIASVSPLHNLPPAQLADQLGALKAEIAGLDGREKALRDELLRRGIAEIEGALFSATITQAARWTLDTNAVKSEMDARTAQKRTSAPSVCVGGSVRMPTRSDDGLCSRDRTVNAQVVKYIGLNNPQALANHRLVVLGDLGDRDFHGAQQHAPLLDEL